MVATTNNEHGRKDKTGISNSGIQDCQHGERGRQNKKGFGGNTS